MIEITEKKHCCGCTACEQICPQLCITMMEDEEGFSYPVVDKDKCVDCHLCEKVCPVLNRYAPKERPLSCHLAKTKDELIRAESSSGGIFTELAMYVLKNKGVVFGVRFGDDWQPEYDYTECVDGLKQFRGSKYVQATMCSAYTIALQFLRHNRQVLFTGTPCIISGLNHFLRNNYDNLITLEVVCHSIPSPKIWKQYLKELEAENQSKISDVTFRDKSNGWSKYSIRIDFVDRKKSLLETHNENAYMRGFLNDLFTRPSCFDCPARNYISGSDLTLADAWEIDKYHPEKNDEKGISHLLVNTEKGRVFIKSLLPVLDSSEINYGEVEPFAVHAPLTKSSTPNPYREQFFKYIQNGFSVAKLSNRLVKRYVFNKRMRRTFIFRVISKLFKLVVR